MAPRPKTSKPKKSGRPKKANDNSVALMPKPGEATEWDESRPFRFAVAEDADRSQTRNWNTLLVTSRDQMEDIIIAKGTNKARKAVRLTRVAADFFRHERQTRPQLTAELVYAVDAFVELFGHLPFSEIRETHMQAVSRAMTLGRERPVGCKEPLAPATVYGRMLRLRALVAYAIVHHFIDIDPIGAQITRPVRLPPKRTIHAPETFEGMRQNGNIDEVMVFDLAVSSGAAEAQVLDLPWEHIDFIGARVYLQPFFEESSDASLGRWQDVGARQMLGLVRGRIDRAKRDRLGDMRVFQHWQTYHGVVGAINTMQFKLQINSGSVLLGTTPTSCVGKYTYRDLRYSAGRAAAGKTYRLHEVANAVGLRNIKVLKRLFGPFLKSPPKKRIRAGDSALFRTLLKKRSA